MGYVQLNIGLLSSSMGKIMNNYYVIFYFIGCLIFLFITLFVIFYLKYKKSKKNAYQYIDIEKMPLKYTKVNKIYVQENTIEI
jgi:heme/copper-type cytochrome/quinol oxidase subunit 2